MTIPILIGVALTGLLVFVPMVRSQTLEQQFFNPPTAQDDRPTLRREADRLMQLGTTQADMGQSDAALQSWQSALNAYQQLGENRGMAEAYDRLGTLYIKLGQLDTAEATTRRWLAIARDEGNALAELYALNRLGAIGLEQGQLDQAQALFQDGLDLALTIDDPEGRGLSLSNLGFIAATRGNHPIALRRYNQALLYLNPTRSPMYYTTTLNWLGESYGAMGRTEDALRIHRIAYEVATQQGDRPNRYRAIDHLVTYYRAQQQWQQAYELLEVRFRMTQEDGDPQQQLITARSLAEFYTQTGDRHLAEQFYQQAIRLAQQLQDIREETRLRSELSALGAVTP